MFTVIFTKYVDVCVDKKDPTVESFRAFGSSHLEVFCVGNILKI